MRTTLVLGFGLLLATVAGCAKSVSPQKQGGTADSDGGTHQTERQGTNRPGKAELSPIHDDIRSLRALLKPLGTMSSSQERGKWVCANYVYVILAAEKIPITWNAPANVDVKTWSAAALDFRVEYHEMSGPCDRGEFTLVDDHLTKTDARLERLVELLQQDGPVVPKTADRPKTELRADIEMLRGLLDPIITMPSDEKRGQRFCKWFTHIAIATSEVRLAAEVPIGVDPEEWKSATGELRAEVSAMAGPCQDSDFEYVDEMLPRIAGALKTATTLCRP